VLRGLLALVGALALGCARYAPLPLAPAASAARLEARSLDDPGLRAFVAAQPGWAHVAWPPPHWDVASLTWVAFYFHPALEVARAEWRASRGEVETASARPNPTLSFVPERATGSPPSPSLWIAAVSFDWPIETAGKRGIRTREAEQRAEALRLQLVATAWQVRGELRRSLVAFAADRRRLVLRTGQAEAADRIAALLERRLAAGAASRPDATQARVAALGADADLAEARRTADASRIRLASALGLTSRALEGFTVSLDDCSTAPATLDEAVVRRAALTGRADVREALADYEASQAALQLEVARQYPDLHLGPGYQFDQGTNKWSIGVSLELPLLNQNQGAIAAARSRREAAAARFVTLQSRVIAELDRAFADDTATRARLAAARAARDAEAGRLRATRRAFDAGEVDRLALRSAELEADVAELAALDAWVERETAAAALEEAVQRPLEAVATVETEPQGSERNRP
jgi:cobalt-zinc-cadmium efflux system outer membrane protein